MESTWDILLTLLEHAEQATAGNTTHCHWCPALSPWAIVRGAMQQEIEAHLAWLERRLEALEAQLKQSVPGVGAVLSSTLLANEEGGWL